MTWACKQALYAAATRSRLNSRQPFAGWQTLKPHLDMDFLRLRNSVDPLLVMSRL